LSYRSVVSRQWQLVKDLARRGTGKQLTTDY